MINCKHGFPLAGNILYPMITELKSIPSGRRCQNNISGRTKRNFYFEIFQCRWIGKFGGYTLSQDEMRSNLDDYGKKESITLGSGRGCLMASRRRTTVRISPSASIRWLDRIIRKWNYNFIFDKVYP